MNVIITGANRGLGKELVRKFASKGNNIWACCRTVSDEYIKWCNELEKTYGVFIEIIKMDLESPESIKGGIKQIASKKKEIDVLINNAGLGHMDLFQMTSETKYRKIYEVNVFAPMQISQMIIRIMIRQGHGQIVNVASTAANEIYEGNSIYGASKAALVAFTQSLAAEVYRYGISVNAIAPGLLDTEMSSVFERDNPEEVIKHTALGRKITPEEIANDIIKLLEMDVINGTVLTINGGHK